MRENKFLISEIITIVMSFVQNIEKSEIYGIDDDDIDLPVNIEDKIESMNEKLYNDFIEKVSYIAEEVYRFKTGELNELNMIHAEIKILAEENLKGYLMCY